MAKHDELARWYAVGTYSSNLLEHMTPIPYKSTGSSYGACGIRIDGNPAFIDSVMSRLTDLIDGENSSTRLELSRQKVDGAALGKTFAKADQGAEVVYIRLHERGNEACASDATPGAYGRYLRAKRKEPEYLAGIVSYYLFLGASRADAENRAAIQLASVMAEAFPDEKASA